MGRQGPRRQSVVSSKHVCAGLATLALRAWARIGVQRVEAAPLAPTTVEIVAAVFNVRRR